MATDSMNKINRKHYLLLHGGFLIISFSGVFLKFASNYDFLSIPFIFFWGVAVSILFVYAIFWQLILRIFPLSTAFANRGVVVAWGIIWGYLIFGEQITIGKIMAALLIFAGIIILGKANG